MQTIRPSTIWTAEPIPVVLRQKRDALVAGPAEKVRRELSKDEIAAEIARVLKTINPKTCRHVYANGDPCKEKTYVIPIGLPSGLCESHTLHVAQSYGLAVPYARMPATSEEARDFIARLCLYCGCRFRDANWRGNKHGPAQCCCADHSQKLSDMRRYLKRTGVDPNVLEGRLQTAHIAEWVEVPRRKPHRRGSGKSKLKAMEIPKSEIETTPAEVPLPQKNIPSEQTILPVIPTETPHEEVSPTDSVKPAELPVPEPISDSIPKVLVPEVAAPDMKPVVKNTEIPVILQILHDQHKISDSLYSLCSQIAHEFTDPHVRSVLYEFSGSRSDVQTIMIEINWIQEPSTEARTLDYFLSEKHALRILNPHHAVWSSLHSMCLRVAAHLDMPQITQITCGIHTRDELGRATIHYYLTAC